MSPTTEDLLPLIRSREEVAAQLLARAASANERTERPATVTITYAFRRAKKSPHIMQLNAVAKIKEPKTATTELSGKTDAEMLGAWDTEEEAGQERIPGAG